MQWLNVAGIGLEAVGIVVGFAWPSKGAQWADENTANEEFRLRARVGFGALLVFVGACLQIYAAWPT